MAAMKAAVLLPFSFDGERLQRDLAAAQSRIAWERHFNRAYHFGEWSGIALRGNSNAKLTLTIDPSRPDEFRDFETFDACPYVREVLASFQCPIRTVRFLKLAPEGGIREHRDQYVGVDFDELRVHVPVLTNDDVDFVVAGERVVMRPGQCWYVDVDQPHSVLNRGTTDRVHLVFDAVVNDWLRELVTLQTDVA
jgi:hypothetical protein